MEREEELAETELLDLQRQVNERLSRLMRLRKQKRQLLEKAETMVRRNVETLDELEAVENAESFAALEAQMVGASDVIDWNELFVDGSPLSAAGS